MAKLTKRMLKNAAEAQKAGIRLCHYAAYWGISYSYLCRELKKWKEEHKWSGN